MRRFDTSAVVLACAALLAWGIAVSASALVGQEGKPESPPPAGAKPKHADHGEHGPKTPPLPTEPRLDGLASRHPGDVGLAKHPAVLFAEDFEEGTVESVGKRWGEISHAENMRLADDRHERSRGKRSLHIARNGHLFTHFEPVDVVFVRFYVKFHEKTGYIHHFVTIYADGEPTPWPKGWAGKQPAGDKLFSSGIEPWGRWGNEPVPGVWHFYSYWHAMKSDGRGDYWGNHFEAKQEPIVPGRWYCVEAMIRANTPGKADGEQAFWIDGVPRGDFKEIPWRTHPALRLNTFWLLYYNTPNAARQNKDRSADRVQEVWFDDIVVAREYIGPVAGDRAP